jgi:hypothetical protein
VVLLFFALLIATPVTYCVVNLPPSRKKQVETLRASIPDAVQFYEDNEDFFDLLLVIQDRVKAGVES